MDSRDVLRARAKKPPLHPLEQVRSFLRNYVDDVESLDELRAELTATAEVNISAVQQELQAFNELLASPPAGGVLARMVAWDANWGLDDDTSDAAATQWLRKVADIIRHVLNDHGCE